MSLQPSIDKCYRTSAVIRTCSRALDEEVPEHPGDLSAVSETLEIARNTLADVIETLELQNKRHSATRRSGGPAAMFEEWKAKMARRAMAVDKAGGNEPDTPEHNALMGEIEALNDAIALSIPCRDVDAIAMLEWSVADSDNGNSASEQYFNAQNAVASFLKGGIEL